MKDSTLIGEKQREIEMLRSDHVETLDLLKELGVKLEGAISDRDQLAEALAADDKQIDQRTADKVVQEREKLKILEIKMASLIQRTSEDAARYQELEVEKNYLSNEVDDLTNWKSVYESEHGLQELARNQRSLKGEEYDRKSGSSFSVLFYPISFFPQFLAIPYLLWPFAKQYTCSVCVLCYCP